jgi:hypothetical protein
MFTDNDFDGLQSFWDGHRRRGTVRQQVAAVVGVIVDAEFDGPPASDMFQK